MSGLNPPSTPTPTGLGPGGLNDPIYASGTSGVQLNPDGTPVLSSGTGGGTQSGGAMSLWDIPSDLTDYLSNTSGGKLFFDIGYRNRETVISSEAGAANSPDIQPGAFPDKTTTSRESYDIMRKPVQVMKAIRAMEYSDPSSFLAIQKALASGVWGDVPENGTWTPQMEHALGQAMLSYVQLSMGTDTAISFKQYLLDASGKAEAFNASSQTQNPIQLTDPTAIRAAAQSAAQDALGKGLSEDQLKAFVHQFQNAQIKYQTAQSGNIDAPDLSAEAMQFVQTNDPKAYRHNQRETFLDTLANMLAGSSVRPSMTPVPSV